LPIRIRTTVISLLFNMVITINIVNSFNIFLFINKYFCCATTSLNKYFSIHQILFKKKSRGERMWKKGNWFDTCLCFWLICPHSRRKYSWNKIKMDLQFLDFQGLHPVSYVRCEPIWKSFCHLAFVRSVKI